MESNFESLALLLGSSSKVASEYFKDVSVLLNNTVTEDMVSKAFNLYLDQNPNLRPSPCDLVQFFYVLEEEYLERVEDSLLDYQLSDWIAQERQKEWEELPWPEEERGILYIATYGHAFNHKEDEDPWEIEQQSIANALVEDWKKVLTDWDHEVSHHNHFHRNRRNKIKKLCKDKSITSLFHFTRRTNLASILTSGLLSRKDLDINKIGNVVINDIHRLDQQPKAICLSMSFPNYKMFYHYSCNDQADWVVLELDVSILWELDCAFCHENAASKEVWSIPLKDRKEIAALENLFVEYAGHPRSNLPANYPTNPQAEILVFDPIPRGYIKAVYFRNKAALQPWVHPDNNLFWCQFKIDPFYFRGRVDYSNWK